jgi:iron complex outermembrane receptor protein
MAHSARLLGSTILLSAAILATPAWAQDTAAEEEQGGIRDIIVTAERREDSVQSVPIAITVLDQQTLVSPIIEDLRDLAGRVPGLVVDSVAAGPSAAAISIRGISFEDIEKSFDPAVGVVVDGVFVGTNTGQLLDSFDLERLEVLRGPQGTLFGRNTIGGVISVTRTRPTEEFGARGSLGYGRFDTKRGRLVVNSGDIGGILKLKGFAFYDDTDGFYRNVTKGRREGQYEVFTYGVTALITPVEGVSAEITYEHMRERGETVVGSLSETGKDLICLAPGAPGFAPPEQCNRRLTQPDWGLYNVFQNVDSAVRNDTDAVTANVNIELGDFLLTSVTGYRTNDESVRQDFDASSANFFDTLRLQDYEQFSQEVRIVGDVTPWLNMLVGAYYFDSNYQLDQSTTFGVVLGGGQPAVLRQYVDHKSKSYAGFADARIKLGERVTLGLGGRYTEDKKRIFNNFGRIGALVRLTQPGFTGVECVRATGTFSPAPGVVLPSFGPANNCTGSRSFGKFTYRANLNYEFDDNKLVYASYSRGFRSGGFNGRASTPTSLGPYFPETVDAYEVGLKADWLNRTLRTNIALFHTKYDNKQEEVVQPAPPGSANPQETVVSNASAARINGIELEMIAQPSPRFSVTASVAFTDAKFKRFFNDLVGLTPGSPPDGIPDDVSTLDLRRAPKYQFSIAADYNQPVGDGRVDVNTVLRFQDAYQTCIAPNPPRIPGAIRNDDRCLTDARERLDAQISYTLPFGENEVKFALFGRNLTDNRGLASTLAVAGLFTFGTAIQPRTYGAEFSFKF